MNPVIVPAIRSNCSTGKESSVEVTFELKENILSIIKGGVTGYESFYVDDSSKNIFQKMGLGNLPIAQRHLSDVLEHGWVACSGTKNRWDRLFVPASSMKIVTEHFEL